MQTGEPIMLKGEVLSVEGTVSFVDTGPTVNIQGTRAELRALRDLIGQAMETGEAHGDPGFGNVCVRVTE